MSLRCSVSGFWASIMAGDCNESCVNADSPKSREVNILFDSLNTSRSRYNVYTYKLENCKQ